METTIWAILIALASVIIGLISGYFYVEQKKRTIIHRINNLNEFSPTLSHYSPSFGIAIDESRKLLAVAYLDKDRVIPFESIVQSSLVGSGQTISTVTKKQGAITRGVAGGLLLGPVGAIVGTVSATEKSVSNVQEKFCKLHILVNEISDPTIEVTFTKGQTAQKWYDTIRVIIHQSELAS